MATREAERLIAATMRGDAKELRRLLATGSNAKAQGRHGATALMYAASDGRLDLVRLLVSRSDLEARPWKDLDVHERTALQSAATFCRTEVVKLLVESGASMEARDNRGFTALHIAAASSLPDRDAGADCVRMLLALGAAPRSRDALGRTPLMNAVLFVRPEACRVLLPVSDVEDVDSEGGDARHYARLVSAGSDGSDDASAIHAMILSRCEEDRLSQEGAAHGVGRRRVGL